MISSHIFFMGVQKSKQCCFKFQSCLVSIQTTAQFENSLRYTDLRCHRHLFLPTEQTVSMFDFSAVYMMAKINHFRNEARDGTNDQFPFDTVEIVWNRHENSSALFSSGRSFVFKICIPPIPNEIVSQLTI